MIARPTSPRDQSLLLVSVVAIALLCAYWYGLHRPTAASMAERTLRVRTLTEGNARATAVLARGALDSLDRQQAALAAELRTLRVLIPSGREVPALLDQILAVARRHDLELGDVAPGETVSGSAFDTYGFRLSLRGTHHEIGEVLAEIASLARIIVPANLTLALATTPGRRAARSGEQVLEASFDVRTFVGRGGAGSESDDDGARAADAVGDSLGAAVVDSGGPAAPGGEGRPLLQREAFVYDRVGRRDPFASLLASGAIRPLLADLRVSGILVDPVSANSVAMVKDTVTGQLYRVKEGSVLGRIRVTAIRAREVAVTVDEFGTARRQVLMLDDPRREKTP
ncbi:MAG: hypothetical protein RI891_548 [Gemmatimonadota bacterium]|jgi:type IV pilus assembly protein PilO